MNSFFQSWEESCNQTDQSIFNNKPIEKHIDSKKCFTFSDPFFVVLDYIERQMTMPEEIREVVLTLSNGPANDVRYMHLVDRWSTMPISIGMIISLAPIEDNFFENGSNGQNSSTDDWKLMDDDQNLYKKKLSCYVNESSRGIILYPHYLLKISSLNSFKACPRAVFFRETQTYNNPTLFQLFGKFASETLQRYVMNSCIGNDVTASDIVDKLKREFITHLHHLSINQDDYKINAIQSLTDFYDQIDKLAEKIDEKHNVLMTVPHTKRLSTVSKAFPGFGAKKFIEDQTIWSFRHGLVGKPSCVVEIDDDPVEITDLSNSSSQEPNSVMTSPPNLISPLTSEVDATVGADLNIGTNGKLVPIEVIGTVGKSDIGTIKNGHIFSLSAQLLLLAEKHHLKSTSANYGFIWYVGSNQKFWIHPRPLIEYVNMHQIRNIVASSVANDTIPIEQRTTDCDICISRTACALSSRMQDKREYIHNSKGKSLSKKSEYSLFDDIEDTNITNDWNFFNEFLPLSLKDFSKNMSRVFYEHYHREIMTDALSSMWCSVRITTSSIEEREKRGYALSKLRISKIDSNQTLKQPTVLFNLTLIPYKPGEHYKLGISRLDSVIITKNGTMPILAFGNISEIKVDHIVISTYEKSFHIGERITIDFFPPNNWFQSDNEILCNLLTNPSYSRIKGFIIDGNSPLFQLKRPVFNSIGLNNRQQEVVSKALSANDYFLINAPHGTGRIVVGLRIVDTFLKKYESAKILIVPFFYSTINKICAGLEILGIPYVVGGKIEQIKEEHRKNHEDFTFSRCKTVNETKELTDKIKVFIIPSTGKQFDILFQRNFNLVIMYEASRIPTIRAIPSLYSSCPLILFGDTVLDNDVDSIYAHFQRINAQQVINLWEMYNCEPAIVAASRVAWGSELRCVSQHARIVLRPLKIISDHQARNFFTEILTMDRPIVFINISSQQQLDIKDSDDNFSEENQINNIKYLINPSVLISIITSLIYSKDNKINVITDRVIQPLVSSSLYFCQTNSEAVFTKYADHLKKSLANIRYYQANSIMSKRKDVTIAITGDKPDSTILTLCLGMTRRKLILIGNLDVAYESPLWATMLNTLPKGWIIDFPTELVEREIPPIKAMNNIFPL